MQYTNTTDIPLVLAVWLAADGGYDLAYDPLTVSATSLMKPTRSLVLNRRIEASLQTVDVADLVQAKLGTAVHTAVEDSWIYDKFAAMERLGIPQAVRDKIVLNPEIAAELPVDAIPIYMEKRTSRPVTVEGVTWTVSGKFDAVVEGTVQDIKTTKVFNYIKGTNDDKYALQGSIYRWLNPDIITNDHIEVLMVFTDWSPLKAQVDKTYPQKRVLVRKLPLLSMEETESWVVAQLQELNHNLDRPQEDLPRCTPEELWMDPPKWAYYKDKRKLARATKLFDTSAEANAYAAKIGSGNHLIVRRDMEPKYCRYCPAIQACTQAEEYINQGILKI